MESGALLEIRNIETYYGLIYAIRGASLSVEVGTITAILETTGRQVHHPENRHGLIEDQPDKGTIEFMGRRINDEDTRGSFGWAFPMSLRDGRSSRNSRPEKTSSWAYLRKDRAGVKGDFDLIYRHFPVLKPGEPVAGTLSGGSSRCSASEGP